MGRLKMHSVTSARTMFAGRSQPPRRCCWPLCAAAFPLYNYVVCRRTAAQQTQASFFFGLLTFEDVPLSQEIGNACLGASGATLVRSQDHCAWRASTPLTNCEKASFICGHSCDAPSQRGQQYPPSSGGLLARHRNLESLPSSLQQLFSPRRAHWWQVAWRRNQPSSLCTRASI